MPEFLGEPYQIIGKMTLEFWMINKTHEFQNTTLLKLWRKWYQASVIAYHEIRVSKIGVGVRNNVIRDSIRDAPTEVSEK
jgi:hypothetical protein